MEGRYCRRRRNQGANEKTLMPQFPKQSTRPLTAASYRAAVRRVRELCDLIDARAVHGLADAARTLSRRHRGETVQAEIAREQRYVE